MVERVCVLLYVLALCMCHVCGMFGFRVEHLNALVNGFHYAELFH